MPKPMRDRIGMGGIAIQRTFDTFDATAQPKAYGIARSFLDGPRSLVFHGPNGVGKTHLALAIGNAIIERDGIGPPVRVCFVSFQDVLLKIRATFKESYEGMGEDYWLARWQNVPLLILDEVGQRGLEDRPSEFTRRIGYQLVDNRYRVGNRPIILTTNKSPGQLGDWITESATDRLFEMGEFVQMEGKSWRRKPQQTFKRT